MSDRRDLDKAAKILQAGGFKITGGKYAPAPSHKTVDCEHIFWSKEVDGTWTCGDCGINLEKPAHKSNVGRKESSVAEVPRWLELKAEIDYWYWVLEQHTKQAFVKPLSPIELLVDQATGYEPKIPKEIRYVVSKIKKLRKEYDNITAQKESE